LERRRRLRPFGTKKDQVLLDLADKDTNTMLDDTFFKPLDSESPMYGTPATDRIFKIVILVLLILSVLTQILVSVWFYDKLKTLESRLSLYPVNKPVDVDLRVTIPELVEIDRKLDSLTQRIDEMSGPADEGAAPQPQTEPGLSSGAVSQKAPRRESTQVDVIKPIQN
jgi:hypothetical protein